MKIIGLLIWYEEQLSILSAAVSSASRVVDHLVAVDGAYFMFPDARPRSAPEQQAHILTIAQSLGLGVTLHAPQEVWYGNEVEKRNVSHQLGAIVGEPHRDWYYVIDADEAISEIPSTFRAELEATELDVAEVAVWERHDPDRPEENFVVGSSQTNNLIRKFFRVLPGLTVVGAHYIVGVPDEDGEMRWLRGDPRRQILEPALQMPGFYVEHRHRYRNPYRARLAQEFYRMREATQAEVVPS